MKITADTRISELIKSNKESIEAIASLAKPFQKLRNPVLRKLMAPRVSIAEAAKIGGCSVGDFFEVLGRLGFEAEQTSNVQSGSHSSPEKPGWLKNQADDHIRYFDVRDILQNGRDPLKQIMSEFKGLEPGGILCIINSFIPTPLIRLLEHEQTFCFTEENQPGVYKTYFKKTLKKTDPPGKKDSGKILMEDPATFERSCRQFSDTNLLTTDVRHLDMPLPMQTILSRLPKLKDDQALYVYHKKIPVYLLEALSDEQWIIHIQEISDHDVRLLIHK